MGYYEDNRTFSVEWYKGTWIARSILPKDKPTEKEEHRRAIEEWLAVGRRKYNAKA